MADAKITQLTEENTLSNDHVLPVVDPSNTSMGASGTTLKVKLSTIASWLASLAQTLTNKRIQKRVTSITSSATPAFNVDNFDILQITALAVNITSMTSSLSGTPVATEMRAWDITPTASRTITWGASFTNSAQASWPTTVTTRTIALGYWTGSAFLCVDVKSL